MCCWCHEQDEQAESRQLLEHLGMKGSEASRRHQFDGVDLDRDGLIDTKEFVSWCRGS
jgi:hypothetical protein